MNAVVRTLAGRFAAALVALCAAALIAACTPSNEPQTFEKAAAEATDSLVAQTGKLPSFLSKIESTLSSSGSSAPKRGIVLDPMLDMITGQQTETTLLFERRVTQRMATKFPQFEFLPFQSSNLTKAQYLLTGTMTRVPTAAKPTVNLSLALTDIRTGVVVAQASALAKEENLDSTPSRYYKDSPVLIKDKVVEGYARTTATPAGQKADPYYMERIGVGTVITEATTLYNAERYQDALGQYKTALATPQGQQLRAESGLYLTSIKLGNTAEAEAGVRPDRRPRHRLQRARREVPVRAGQRRLLGRSEDQRRLPDVAAPDRPRRRPGRQLHDGGRPHQQERARGGERRAVAEARGDDQAEAGRRAAGARRENHRRGHGLSPEHRRQRHRQQLRRPRSASRVQDRALPVRPCGVST